MANKPNLRSPDHRPWHPVLYTVDHVYAVQNLARGEANEVQQKMALEFIVNRLCGTYDSTYFPDSHSDSDFANGKRHVGMQLVKLINMPGKVIAQLDKGTQGRNRESQEGQSDE